MTTTATKLPEGTFATCLRELRLRAGCLGAALLPDHVRAAFADSEADPRCEHGRSIYDVHHDCDGAV